MASLNKVILMGNVGAEPEIKDTTSTKIATISLCTTTKGYTKQDGTKIDDKSEWHRIKAFSKTAEIIEKYVHKGSSLYIEGHLHYDTYEKDGKKVYTTEVIMDNFQFLGSKSDNGNNTPNQAPMNESKFDDKDVPF